MNESVPNSPSSGVYVTESPEIEPSDPLVGPSTICSSSAIAVEIGARQRHRHRLVNRRRAGHVVAARRARDRDRHGRRVGVDRAVRRGVRERIAPELASVRRVVTDVARDRAQRALRSGHPRSTASAASPSRSQHVERDLDRLVPTSVRTARRPSQFGARVIVIDTVAGSASAVPSDAAYVNESLAVLNRVRACRSRTPPAIVPSEPFDGPSTIDSVSASPSGSVQTSGTDDRLADRRRPRHVVTARRPGDRDARRRGRGVSGAVRRAVGERVRAELARVRRIGDRMAGIAPEGALRRAIDDRQRQRVAVEVGTRQRAPRPVHPTAVVRDTSSQLGGRVIVIDDRRRAAAVGAVGRRGR